MVGWRTVVVLLISLCFIDLSLLSNHVMAFTIPIKTIGPQFTNLLKMQSINITQYNGRLPTVNYSWPILKMVGTVSLSGAASTYGATFMNNVYPFYVDMINLQGGVQINGVPHLLQMQVADDQGSTVLMQYLYDQWLADPSILVFHQPPDSAMMKVLNPMMVASGRIWFNSQNGDALDFAPKYRYQLTASNLKNDMPTLPLTTINDRAIEYHESVSGKDTFDLTTRSSPYGITSACIYEHADSTGTAVYAGIKQWIQSENERRVTKGASFDDLISVRVNFTWYTGSASLAEMFVPKFAECSGSVDLIAIGSFATAVECTSMSSALAQSGAKPKAAWNSCDWSIYNPTDPKATAATIAAAKLMKGWTGATYPPKHLSTLPVSVFTTQDDMIAAWKLYFNTVPSVTQTLFVSNFDILATALTTAASKSPPDVRNAWLNIPAGSYTFAGRQISIDNVTGVNIATKMHLSQLDATGVVPLFSHDDVVYPVFWPWMTTTVGSPIEGVQNSIEPLIGVILTVLGCWVALIIVEQSVYIKRRKGKYQIWLIVVAISLGGCGVWCSMLMQASGQRTRIPDEKDEQPMQFSLPFALISLLPALFFTFIGLFIIMEDVHRPSNEASTATPLRMQDKRDKEDKRKAAALDHKTHLIHLFQAFSFHVLIGSCLVGFACSSTRYTLTRMWVQNANSFSSTQAWIGSSLAHIFLTTPALLAFFHGVRWRFLAVFVLSGAIMLDWQLHAHLMKFTLTEGPPTVPTALYEVGIVDGVVIQLISGIIGVALCITFIGLMFSRMQLSRNGLAVLVASMENSIAKQKIALVAEQQRNGALLAQADHLAKIIECINLLSPVPKQYSYALAICSSTSTAANNYDFKLGQAVTDVIAPLVNREHRMHMEELNKELSEGRNVIGAQPVSHRRPLSLNPSSANSSVGGRAIMMISTKVEPADTEIESVPGMASPKKSPRALGVATRGSWGGGASNSVVPLNESNGEGDRDREQSSANSNHLARTSISVDQSLAPVEEGNVAPKTSPHPVPVRQMRDSMKESMKEMTVSSRDGASHASANGAHQTHQVAVDHVTRVKQFESEALSLLQNFTKSASTFISGISETSVGESTVSESMDFSMHASLISLGLNERSRSRVSRTFPHPTLPQLLQHPVCVEIVKAELDRIRSIENALFYIHALRYRKLVNPELRMIVARSIYQTFIVAGADQQININTRQREAIAHVINQKRACSQTLFAEAERETLLLMETNLMKTLVQSPSYRLCQWIMSSIDISLAYQGLTSGGQGDTNHSDDPASVKSSAQNQVGQKVA